jgi:uncharacterized protein
VEEYKTIALKAIDQILVSFQDIHEDESQNKYQIKPLLHTYKEGRGQYSAFLEDYAYLITALIDVYQIGFDFKYLQLAEGYIEYVLVKFFDGNDKLFYFTSSNQTDIIVRKKDLYDNATPAGNSMMVSNLSKVGILLERADFRSLAVEMIQEVEGLIKLYPGSFSGWASSMLALSKGYKEIVIVGNNALEEAKVLNIAYLPNKLIVASVYENETWALTKGRYKKDQTLVYLCQDNVCGLPSKSVRDLKI